MDVSELLSYQPSVPEEENNQNEEEDKRQAGPSSKKRQKQGIGEDGDEAAAGAAALDETALKRMLLNLERKVLRNQELRVKFSDNPSKFMDSEVELFEILQEMHVLSTQPELYRVVVELNVVPTLLGILSHENADVACAAVHLIQELTDLDDVDEMAEVAVLIDALVDQQLIPLLVSNLDRLDEDVKEESEGVYNSLAIIENLTDYNPDLTKDSLQLITWILKRLKSKLAFNTNKLYASEILSILVQSSDQNRLTLGSLEGIDTILQQLSYYKKYDPASADEQEYMENLYDILCSSLLCCPSNREIFFKGEGIELMNLILKDKRRSPLNSSVKMGSLKVMSHVLSGDKEVDDVLSDCCSKFVDILGLRVLFPILMQPKSIIGGVKKRETATAVDQIEEQCLTILLALLRFCPVDQKKRIVVKFVECEFEKTERMLELHYKFAETLAKCEQEMKREGHDEDDEDDPDVGYVRRLTEGGLFVLQMVDQVMVMCCLMYDEYFSDRTEQESIRERLLKLLKMHASQVDHMDMMRSVLREMASQLDDESEKKRITGLVSRF